MACGVDDFDIEVCPICSCTDTASVKLSGSLDIGSSCWLPIYNTTVI
jgi:hypothetical protein